MVKIVNILLIFMFIVTIPIGSEAAKRCVGGSRDGKECVDNEDCPGLCQGTDIECKAGPNNFCPGQCGPDSINMDKECYDDLYCGGVFTAGCTNNPSCIGGECKEFDDGDDGKLLVELRGFSATAIGNQILLDWKTDAEFNSVSFFIWKGIPKDGNQSCTSKNPEDYNELEPVNDPNSNRLLEIPSRGGPRSGACYSHIDTIKSSGTTYCYMLEERDSKGERHYYLDYIASVGTGNENRFCSQNN